ncbi:MAG TPA: hypothetical protein VFI31_08115 [Pirellulales bacterium]|nr:hypothetical protein [Pirellulales bacterium]
MNPYESPKSECAALPSTADNSRHLYFGWFVVFLFNLGVPLIFGWPLTEEGGRSGLFAGALALFLLGCALCAWLRPAGRALVVGGVVVGLSQILPFLQIMAGVAGLSSIEILGFGRSPHGDATLFVVTVVTGGLLMAVALVVGLAVRGVLAMRRGEAR